MSNDALLNRLYDLKNWGCGGDSKLYETAANAIKAVEKLQKIEQIHKQWFNPLTSAQAFE